MSAADAFLLKIEQYLTASGMKPTVFSREAVGDPAFVGDLRTGRMPSLRLVEKVYQYIAANPPKVNSEAAE